MARPLTHSLYAGSPEVIVREHFGLSQEELARLLGVTRGLVTHFEAGRRLPTPATSQRLDYLVRLLPPPTGRGPVAPRFEALTLPPPTTLPTLPDLGGALAPAPLRRRWLQVRAQASRLRLALHQAGKGEVLQRRREWGLTVLLAALPPADVTDKAELAHISRWLTVLTADVRGTASTPATRAAQALLLLRIQALEAETGMLARLLEESSAAVE